VSTNGEEKVVEIDVAPLGIATFAAIAVDDPPPLEPEPRLTMREVPLTEFSIILLAEPAVLNAVEAVASRSIQPIGWPEPKRLPGSARAPTEAAAA
jgi:hypothetical protein